MSRSSRRDWIFAGIAVAIAIATAIALVIRLTDDDDEGSSITRTTPWQRFATIEDVGTMSYSCGFPGRLMATRLAVTPNGAPVNARVELERGSIAARIQPGGLFAAPYSHSGSNYWQISRKLKRGRIRSWVPTTFPPIQAGGRPVCTKPSFSVAIARPKEPGD
jgi:hypothetical protein